MQLVPTCVLTSVLLIEACIRLVLYSQGYNISINNNGLHKYEYSTNTEITQSL